MQSKDVLIKFSGQLKTVKNFIKDDWSKFSHEEQYDKKMQTWNIDNFIKSCTELNTNIKVKNFILVD